MEYYWLFVIPALILSLISQVIVKSTYSKYSKVFSRYGHTGAYVATDILNRNGIYDVMVQKVRGELTDNFNPTNKMVSLSQDVFESSSISAIGIASHEVGHVTQYYQGYKLISLRNTVQPVASFASSAAMPLVLLGYVLGFGILVEVGVWIFLAVVVFQLLTLPVELNASRRAVNFIRQNGYLAEDEIPGVRKVLNAAAFTYLAALLVSLAQFLRLFAIIYNRRK